MLNGKTITLRPLVEDDIDQMYAHMMNLDNRDEHYSLSFRTMAELRRDIAENGLWTDDLGVLGLIDNESDKLVGQIVWFKTVQYYDEIEIGYIMYDQTRRSKGGMTEALKLFTNFLFDSKPLNNRPVNRIRLCIATENVASRRVAEKAGYTHEATQRQAAYGRNRHYDMELYAIIRSDPRPPVVGARLAAPNGGRGDGSDARPSN
jgi:ribosomal-protein-alanine N-acetyltransferase